MNNRKIVIIAAFLTVGAILAIYVYDMFSCIFTSSPIPLTELLIFLAILIGTISVVVVLRKKLQ